VSRYAHIMSERPLYEFISDIQGKNAKVSVFSDRIEWAQPRGVSKGKLTAGIMTMGMSLAATGVRGGKAGTEMIPVQSISSVTTKRDGMLNTIVSVITAGNTIDFRVSHAEAETVKKTLTDLVLRRHAAPAPFTPPQAQPGSFTPPWQTPPAQPVHIPKQPTHPSQPAQIDVAAQLQQLLSLRDQGLITPAEFDSKRAEILNRF
jgi:hypothetical protein